MQEKVAMLISNYKILERYNIVVTGISKLPKNADRAEPSSLNEIHGATRQDRTGDLLITNLRLWTYAIHSAFG
jgi:hypothetical protein